MLTPHDIDKIVAERMNVSVTEMHSDETRREISNARAMGCLKLKQFLGWGTVRSRKHYGKDSHTTVMSALKTINNLINTGVKFDRQKTFADMSIRIDADIRKRLEFYKRKEIYNLNYRVRQKNIDLFHKDKTVSINLDELAKLDKKQVKKLLAKHNYKIQLKLF